jgi:hypothetical protein
MQAFSAQPPSDPLVARSQLPWSLAEAVRGVWQTGDAVASFVSW